MGPCVNRQALSQGLLPTPSVQHGESLASLTLKAAVIQTVSHQRIGFSQL